jgi:hypothetical protein
MKYSQMHWHNQEPRFPGLNSSLPGHCQSGKGIIIDPEWMPGLGFVKGGRKGKLFTKMPLYKESPGIYP